MYQHRPWLDERPQGKSEQRQTASLLGIIIVLALLVTSLYLVHHLRHATAIEDCLLAGRRNCDVLVIPGR